MNGRPRILSLDALRGFDMVWLIGHAAAVRAFCGAFPGGEEWWLARQMHHCSWEGFRFYDLIFPLFLFMAGVSFPFSYASQVRKGFSSLKIHMRLVKRVAVLVALQMVQSGMMAFDPTKYTYPSVLVRIALPWFLAALVYIHLRPRVRVAVAIGVLVVFWAILTFWQSPIGMPGSDNYAVRGGIVDYLDRFLSLRAWIGHDPFEMRDIPLSIFSVPLALSGMFAGDIVRSERLAPVRRALALAVIGAALLLSGVLVAAAGCPIVKNLSTPSFMLVSGGLCFLLFAAFHWVIDVKGFVRWSYPLRIVGMNSLAAYLSPYFIDFMKPSVFLLGGIASLTPCAGFVLARGAFCFAWLFLWLLYRAKIFIKA